MGKREVTVWHLFLQVSSLSCFGTVGWGTVLESTCSSYSCLVTLPSQEKLQRRRLAVVKQKLNTYGLCVAWSDAADAVTAAVISISRVISTA